MLGDREGLIDFTALSARLRVVAVVVASAALVGIVVDGLTHGLSFAILVRWLVGALLALVLAGAVLVAVHAGKGANAAQRRGERLSGEDVGLVPPRRHPRSAETGSRGRRRREGRREG